MAGELLDNKGRGEASWGWPPIHPEGRKYGLIATAVSLVVAFGFGLHIIGMLLLALSAGVFALFRDPERVVPVGLSGLRAMLERFIDVGFSKFVVRPLEQPESWRSELEALAGAVLELQT